MSQTFFTADTHFGHAKIVSMCERPFDVEGHDEALIANWNERVRDDDVVYHLGDFAYRTSPQRVRWIFDQLNGRKSLILGNHDHLHGSKIHPTQMLPWESISEQKEIMLDGQAIVLNHYSLRVWRNMRRGAIQLYGHSHARLPGSRQSIDVGVDNFNYRPATLDEIKQRLQLSPPLEFRDADDEIAQLVPNVGINTMFVSRDIDGGFILQPQHVDEPKPVALQYGGQVPVRVSGRNLVVRPEHVEGFEGTIAEMRRFQQPNAVRVSFVDGRLQIVGCRLGDGEYPRVEDGALIVPASWDHDSYAIDEQHVDALREMLTPSTGMKP